MVTRDGRETEVRANISVGADGRFSTLRRLGAFEVAYEHHSFDVMWFTIPEPADTPPAFRMFMTPQRAYLALPKEPALIQCGMLLPAGGFASYQHGGIEALRAHLLAGPPLVHAFARQLADLEPFVLLQAKLDMVRQWARDGLLLVGDAAHTCSPVGAVGVSVAVETAAMAAEVLARCVERRDCSAAALGEVQARREPSVRAIHRVQRRLGGPVAGASPWGRRLFAAVASLGSVLGISGPFGSLAAR